jgi:hypothetical protein
MRVRERKQREEGECHPAHDAAPTMNPNPIVMLVVGLLAAAAMTDNRISFTKRASAYDVLVTVFGPVGCNPVRHDGN